MAKYATGYVTVEGTTLHYYRGGNGRNTIVLLHGATDNGMCWKRVADLLSEQYDVVMPDAQGHGLSDRLGESFTFLDHARQAAGLVRELALEHPVFIGHSMGGSTAANLAALYPDLPRAIVLEDPGWIDPTPEMANGPDHNEIARIARAQQQKTPEELMAQCRLDNPSWDEEELGPWAESKHQFDTNLFKFLKIDDPPYRETVAKIICPTLLVTSETGIVSDKTVVEVMGKWAADTPLRHIKVMGAGHNIRREQFETFYASVKAFIEDL